MTFSHNLKYEPSFWVYTLVGAFHSEEYDKYNHCRVNTMGPWFYMKEDQGEFHHWMRQYPESILDTMTICHYPRLQEEMDSARLRHILC